MTAAFRATAHALAAAVAATAAACSDSERPDDAAPHPKPVASIRPADEALSGADIPTVDPHTMADAEIEKVVDGDRLCLFRYTSSSKPILAFAADGEGAGVVKLNGHLVRLTAASADDRIVLAADPVRLTLSPDPGSDPPFTDLQTATLVFEIGDMLKVGYDGYYGCEQPRS